MPTNTEDAIPTSTLCTLCTDLKLAKTDFYLTEEEAKKKANPSNVYDPITIDTRSWQNIETAKNCDLCQMIKCAVETSRFEWQSSESPNVCDIKLTRLHGYYSGTYDVRYLEIVAHYDLTSSDNIALLPVECDEYPGCFPGRVVDSTELDIHRITAWMDQCQSMHGDKCRHAETPQFQELRTYILVLDVEDRCLVTLPPTARYIALSYVWGNVQQPMTRRTNLESLKMQNGLDSIYSQLPRVISDAMSFVKAFGERYLWVDTLCIIQDDADFKNILIGSMHIVYENAYLTLFAATGTDSNAGLPGVQPNSRGASQLGTRLSDGLALIFPVNYENIKRSKWATRAWTYQEYFFAKRRLLFVDGQVVYQCNTVRWREDIAQEHLENGLVRYQVDDAGSRMSWEPPARQFPNARSDQWRRFHFNSYLETYLDRNLTFDNDILNAFAGIIHEAEKRKLKCCWGLTEKHIGIDMLWLPCRWLVRRPGFPSWSWAGWKGPIIPYGNIKTPSEMVWQHRKSWIDWYIFRKSSGKFHLLSSGYVPQSEAAVVQEEKLERGRNERLAATQNTEANGEDSDETKACVGFERGSLASLLWRLCQSNTVQTPSERESPYPLYCIPTINEQTLLFRTLTAYVAISSLNPSGKMSPFPRDDQLLLPSAPTLHLYAPDGTHIGSAWPHTQEFFNKVAAYDRESINQRDNTARLQIEVALIAGPVQGDWRTRIENPSTGEYMLELAGAGLHLGMLKARYERKLSYEQTIEKSYISMVRERQEAENDADTVEARLTVASGTGITSKKGQSFIKVILIGNLGDGETNGSGGLKERVGMGEIRDDAMGLIQGLAVRDVMLK